MCERVYRHRGPMLPINQMSEVVQMAHMTVAKLVGCVRVCWSGFADHKPPSRLSVPAMGPVPLHTAECIYNRKPHSCTHTLYLCTISRFSLQRALCVCAALWQPDHVTITPLRCHKHCLFNTAVLSLSACKRRGGVIAERGRDGEEWERAAKEGFVVACVFTGRGPLWHSLSEKQQMHAWRRTSAEFTDQ